MDSWKPISGSGTQGVAIANYLKRKEEAEELNKLSEEFSTNHLPLLVGDVVSLEEECNEWYLGRVISNPSMIGIFPKSFIHTYLDVKEDLPIVAEIAATLHEWHQLVRQLYVQQHVGDKEQQIKEMQGIMRTVMDMRDNLIANRMTHADAKETQQRVTTFLDLLNHRQGLDLVVRDEDGNKLSPFRNSAVAMYRQHLKSGETVNNSQQMKMGPRNKIDGVAISNSFRVNLTVKNFIAPKVNRDVDLVISIYDVSDEQSMPKALCENFVIKGWRRVGDQSDLSNRDNLKVVFGDIYKNDIANKKGKLYLICNAIYNGNYCDKILDEGRKNAKSEQALLKFKKPAGVAAVDISNQFTFRGGKTQEPQDNKLDMPFLRSENETETLHQTFQKLIANRANTGGEKLVVGIRVEFAGDALLQVNKHAKCHHYKNYKNSMLMESSVLHAKRLGLPDVILPNDVRNDLYVTISHGELTKANFKGGSATKPNMEVTMEVCDTSGNVVADSVSCGETAVCSDPDGTTRESQNINSSGLEPVYRTVVHYHVGKITWNEVIKVSVSTEQFSGCHLRFTFRHCGRNDAKQRPLPVALGFLKLVNTFDGTALKDGEHYISVYKIEKNGQEFENGKYLNERMEEYRDKMVYIDKNEKKQIKDQYGFTPLNETFVVKTTLASTKLTQNEGLSSLLKWRNEPRTIQRSLQMFERKINGDELVKFIPDVLDALFSILMETEEDHKFNNFENVVFKNIIKCISLITEEGVPEKAAGPGGGDYMRKPQPTTVKHHHFIPVLELYILENFYHRLAYEKLLDVLKVIAENTQLSPREAENTMEVLKYLFKFIVRSRLLYTEYDQGGQQEEFEDKLKEVLDSLKDIMFYRAKEAQKAQSACMKNLIASIPDLSNVISQKKLAEVLKSMICALPDDQLEEEKMDIIKDLIQSQIFQDRECRLIILPEITKELKGILERSQTMTLCRNGSTTSATESRKLLDQCTNTLGDVLDALHKVNHKGKHKEDIENQDVSEVMSTCLRTIVQHVANRQQNDPNIPKVVANMISIFQAMASCHFKEYYQRYQPNDQAGRENMIDMINEMLGMFLDLIKNNVYETSWSSMILLQNSVILKALKEFSYAIQEYLVTPFEKDVWGNYFLCAIKFITQPSLQVEKFSENKRKQILSMYKDMRKEMGLEVTKMWYFLGRHKIEFIPDMVGPFLEMTLIPEPDLRKATIPIFFDMMQCEYFSHNGDDDSGMEKQNFDDLEDAIISNLDSYITDIGEGDDHYRDLFVTILKSSCDKHTSMREMGKTFVKKAGRLMELLLEYRRITKEQEDVKENHMSCIKNLLDFYASKNIDRRDSYIKYLRRLSDLHKDCKNWAEASFTLLQYAKLLKWDNTPLDEVETTTMGKTAKTHIELKEHLYLEVINMFNDGKMWENALEMCKELMTVYESETFEFDKLATLLTRMSSYYDNIMKELRHEHNYFRVGFYGRGFPAFLQNKVFVFRGKIFETLADFKSRISDQYPKADMMTTMDPPSDEDRASTVQRLQIIKVDPVVEEKPEFEGRNVHQKILSHFKSNQVSKFMYSRPYHWPKKNKEVEFASLWLEQTILYTTETFPGMLQWFPLAKEPEVIKLCPLETQIEAMEKANNDLKELLLSFQNPDQPLNALTMRLNGIIDAAVNGGTANYEKAFFTDQYLEENPDHKDKLNEIQAHIANQIPLLSVGLAIHDEKKSDAITPLHDRLATMFTTMQAEVEKKYGEGECDLNLKRFSMVSRISDQSHISTPPNRDSVEDYNTLRKPPNITHHSSNGNLMNGSAGSNVDLRTKSSTYLNVTEKQATRGSNYTDRVSNYMRIGIKTMGRRSSNVKEKDTGRLNAKFPQSHNSFEEHPGNSNSLHPTSAGIHTSRPSSGQFLSSTPNHSRSPSNSNRGSITSQDGSYYESQLPQPPPVPPKNLKGHFYGDNDSLVSVEENNFINNCQNEMNNASNSLSQEFIVELPVPAVKHSKKKAPPPPPPSLIQFQDDAKTPPTPPKKPPIKLPID